MNEQKKKWSWLLKEYWSNELKWNWRQEKNVVGMKPDLANPDWMGNKEPEWMTSAEAELT